MAMNDVHNTKKVMIHALKTFPSARLNAGGDGYQKTGELGGALRARLSGQNICYNIRHSEYLTEVAPLGIRTRYLPSLVVDELSRMRDEDADFANVDEEFIVEAAKKLTKFGSNGDSEKESEDESDKKKGNAFMTNQTLFFTDDDVKTIAEAMRKEILNSKDIKEFKKLKLDKISGMKKCVSNPISLDMSLFGRMVTSDNMMNVPSAVQIANALSTHAIHRETDFYSCIDDIIASNASSGKGAAIMDNKDFNGSCYYMYAAVDLDVLRSNLDFVQGGEDLLIPTVDAFIKAFAYEYSRTSQSRYAAQVFPDMVYVEIQKGYAPTFSYVNAFNTPVPSYGDKPEITRNSVEAFKTFVDKMKYHDIRKINSAYFAPEYSDLNPADSKPCGRFTDLIDFVNDHIKE